MKSYGRSKGRRRNVGGGEGFGLQRGEVRKRERGGSGRDVRERTMTQEG